MRKQTKIWITKEGNRIRICDMSDTHLINSILLLERIAEIFCQREIEDGFNLLSILQGECAIDTVESRLDMLEDYGKDASEINPLYDNLCLEAERRNLTWKRK